jgi:hypothetical protein
MRKKYDIDVLWKHTGNKQCSIKRTLQAQQIGNFNPVFCRYQGGQHLVKSKEGDLSDPFRRNASYEGSLYIEIVPQVEARDGLLYWANGGELVRLPFADTVARAHGFQYAEQLVQHLQEKGEGK